MRKSERIRQLELAVVRLQLELEMINKLVGLVINEPDPQMDAGKWYNRRPDLNN